MQVLYLKKLISVKIREQVSSYWVYQPIIWPIPSTLKRAVYYVLANLITKNMYQTYDTHIVCFNKNKQTKFAFQTLSIYSQIAHTLSCMSLQLKYLPYAGNYYYYYYYFTIITTTTKHQTVGIITMTCAHAMRAYIYTLRQIYIDNITYELLKDFMSI